jgi:hypothetical protein
MYRFFDSHCAERKSDGRRIVVSVMNEKDDGRQPASHSWRRKNAAGRLAGKHPHYP